MTGESPAPPSDWMDEGPHSVAPGVHRIPLPLPHDALRGVNVYAVECDEGLILIDSGVPEAGSRARLDRGLSAIGGSLDDVVAFLVTHAHNDHYTQAVAVRREFRTRVLIGAGEEPSMRAAHTPGRITLQTQLDILRGLGCADLAEDLVALGVAGKPVDLTNWEFPDEWIEPDRDLEILGTRFTAIATPGHTSGHLVFAHRDAGVMFTGDHVLPHITPSIGLEPMPSELPLQDYLYSLERVRRMPDLRMLPAHGMPAESVHTRVAELLDHHHVRLAACEEAVASGAITTDEVAALLPWTGRGRALADLSPFDQMLAVVETAAHLDVLVSTRRLLRVTESSGQSYRPATSVRLTTQEDAPC